MLLMIEKLKVQIQKDKVDEVCSIFHFLSLALFPNLTSSSKKSDHSRNKPQIRNSSFFEIQQSSHIHEKIVEQIFYVIRDNHRQIIDMFKNKESLTIKCLGEDIRKKAN